MDYQKIRSKRLQTGCMKKALAVSLAVITALTALPVDHAPKAAAAKKYVSLRTTFKTLAVGQVNKMTLKNNTIGWKITKVSTQDRTVAMVYGKTESSFLIKGKKEGRTTVRAKLKTTKRRKFTEKTVRCRVRVTAQADVSNPTDVSASTQAEIEAALRNNHLKKLRIITDQAGKLTIPKGSYPDVELLVHAPAADIENNGLFQSITIEAIKPDTWIENAVGNLLHVTARAARILVNEGARLKQLDFACVDAKISLEVNGMIDELSIRAKMELTVSGKPQAPIPTIIEEGAEGTVIESSAPLKVTANASADITFHEGAEGSTVDIKSKDAKVEVTNKTNATITIRKADGTIESKRSGSVALTSPSYKPYTPPAESRPSLPSTPGAVITTGGSLDTETPDDTPGDDSGVWIPGDIDGSGTSVGRFPVIEDFKNIMNPEVMVTITRSAITGSTSASPSAVTMSAILALNLQPDQVPIANGYAQWSWVETEGAFEEARNVEEETITFDFDPQDYAGLVGDDPIGLQVKLIFRYIVNENSQYIYDTDRTILSVYDKPILDQYLAEMERQGLEAATLRLPLTKSSSMNGYSVLSYEYNKDYLSVSHS